MSLRPKSYWCPYCEENHQETTQPNKLAILEGKCSANHRTPPNIGNWRVCHAPFTLMGGPHVIGSAQLCTPCRDKLFAPALAMQKALLEDLKKRGLA